MENFKFKESDINIFSPIVNSENQLIFLKLHL